MDKISTMLISNTQLIQIMQVIIYILIVALAIALVALMLIPKAWYQKISSKYKEFSLKHKNAAEIIRFIIVGGIATVIDMFTMGVVMYFMQRSIYPSFINVFINTPTPSTFATIMGTSAGFIAGLIVNYVLSIIFVFNEKGNSKTLKGFAIFTALSVIGLLINIVGTYIGFDLLHLNQWLVKVVMVLIVLVYNYISKRLILFKKKPIDKKASELKEDNDSTTKAER